MIPSSPLRLPLPPARGHPGSEYRLRLFHCGHPQDLIVGEAAATGTVRRTNPAVFMVSETFDEGMDASSPVANDSFDEAPFMFEGTLKRLYFRNLPAGNPGFMPTPDDD